ncbi:MAG: HlyD family secretion protein [Bryobacteraceae bacterium]
MSKIVLAIAMLLVGAVSVSYLTDTPLTTLFSRKPAPVAAAPKETKPAAGDKAVVAAGRVEPADEEIAIGAEIEGRLARVYVKEGDRVGAGALLAELVNDDYRARVELAKAQVAEKSAALSRLRNGSRQEERALAQARLREEQARLESAKIEVARRRPLVEHGAVSRMEFALAEREEATARAKVDAANEDLNLIRSDTRAEDLQRAAAELAAAAARQAETEAQLTKTYIRAPSAGVVLRRWRKSGESVSFGSVTPIVSLGDLSRLRVRIDVDEADVARIRVGQKAYFSADAYPGRKFTGRVISIAQALGRKNVRTDEPTERVDKKILETLAELDPGQVLPVGLRVDAFLIP